MLVTEPARLGAAGAAGSTGTIWCGSPKYLTCVDSVTLKTLFQKTLDCIRVVRVNDDLVAAGQYFGRNSVVMTVFNVLTLESRPIVHRVPGDDRKNFSSYGMAVVPPVSSFSDRTLIVSGDSKSYVAAWDALTGEHVTVFDRLPNWTWCIRHWPSWSPELYATSSTPSKGKIGLHAWDLTTGEKTREYAGHTMSVIGLDADLDTGAIYTVSDDRTCHVWDRASEGSGLHRDCVSSFGLLENKRARAVYVASDLRLIFIAMERSEIVSYDPRNTKEPVSHHQPTVKNRGDIWEIARVSRRRFISGCRGSIGLTSWDLNLKPLESSSTVGRTYGVCAFGTPYDVPLMGPEDAEAEDADERLAFVVDKLTSVFQGSRHRVVFSMSRVELLCFSFVF